MTKTVDIVAALRELIDELIDQGNHDPVEVGLQVAKRFPEINLNQLEHACAVLIDDSQEESREVDAKRKSLEELLYLLDGRPTEIPSVLDEAIALKAQQGDPVALRWQAAANTKQHCLFVALFRAAFRAHPQCKEPSPNCFEWTGDGMRPSTDAMIDWFQMTHPVEAARIEKEIDQ